MKVKLQDQPGQILSALLEVPGDLVSREELRKRLWSADTFVDFDHSLNTAIKRLRDALGDSADNPIFVETLSRRGYRFMAPITEPTNEHKNGHGLKVTAIVANSAVGATGRWSARFLWWGLAGLVITTGAVSAGWHAGHRAIRPIQPREIRLTTNSADAPIEGGAISPDGRMLVYQDKLGIHVKDTSSGETHPVLLPPDFTVTWASWFPDQNHILAAAATNSKERIGLYKVSLLGGMPQKLMEDAETGRVSPDGRKIAFTRGEFPRREIWTMNVDGGGAHKEVEPPGYIFGVPVWSPDSRMFAFLRVIYYPSWSDEDVRMETHFVGSDKSQTVLTDRQITGGITWLADGRLFFTLSEAPSAQGDTNLWAMPIDLRTGLASGERVRITNGPDHKPVIDSSADGKKILFLRTNIQPAVYVSEIDQKTKVVGHPERLTLDDRKNLPYEWTPDGKSVLYISNREGKFHIYRQAPGEGSPELLDTGSNEPNILRLNPDRTEILYTSDQPTETQPYVAAKELGRGEGDKRVDNLSMHSQSSDVFRVMSMPLSGGKSQVLLEWPQINNFQCARAPARECIFSSFTNEALEFYEFDAQKGKPTLMFRIADPEWQLYNWTLSPNGELLALAKKLRAQEEAEIQIMSLRGGSTRKIVLKDWRMICTIDWAADGKSIWTSASPRVGEELLINVDLQGHVKPAVKEGSPYVGWAIPSQDGKRLAIWEASGASNVWMLENF
ncbi:MAG TPA: winged helix-turn-helix domain-containing protein [Candidatus Dormibacteraeota bacterium]|nr:winged helix-turn-helix domain-containing protein [Candidatus Dormibacteraeota bacterium]